MGFRPIPSNLLPYQPLYPLTLPIFMDIGSIILIVGGLVLFETITSIDNAIINAEVLSTMSEKAKKWFLTWGLLIAVFGLRGLLPFVIVWAVNPALGPVGAITATFSNDPNVHKAIQQSTPILLAGGGIFMVFIIRKSPIPSS